jgi:RNA polymerase sigma-70 factor (ECF subfamily)
MVEDELSRLYSLYGPVIYARCRSLLGDDAAAEDATQETFIRVFRHLSRLPPGQEALFWIHRVATNHCLNELKARRRRPLLAAEEFEASVAAADAAAAPIVEERLVDRDLAARVIGGAQTKLRAAAWLYYVDGFEQEEVAGILGLSRRSVASYLAVFIDNARKFVRRTGS